MKFNLNKIPDHSNARTTQYRQYSISILCLIMGILLGRYLYSQRNLQVKQPESPIVTETPTPSEPLPTPTPEASPQPPIQKLPKENPSDNPPTLQVPSNPSDEQMSCLKYGGGAACFADQYQPNLPEPSSPQQLPPSLPDLPEAPSEDQPNTNDTAIAVISGREVRDWTPDYNLPPMSAGVCPPSWVIAYQDQLFCNRRLILQPSQPIRRFRRFR
jgi:hypothetical protein